jgi:hypothetical protein
MRGNALWYFWWWEELPHLHTRRFTYFIKRREPLWVWEM